MNRQMLFVSFAFASLAASAVPVVTLVTARQESVNGIVTVGYHVSEDAVVTFDVQTNGVSIGLDKVRRVWGDVNRRIAAGDRELKWNPQADWSDAIDVSACTFAVKAWSLAHPPDYLAINLDAPNDLLFYAGIDALPYHPTNVMMKSKWLLMRKIPAAGVRWRMGSPDGESGRTDDNERPHYVTLDHDYYMGVHKLTCAQYGRFCELPYSLDVLNIETHRLCPARYMGVEALRGVTEKYDWPDDGHDVDENLFLGLLRKQSGVDTLDLPTDAEWEYACRAGTAGPHYNNKDDSHLPEIAWFDHKTDVQEVGLLEPNAWGLYDMIGNGFELCLDWFSSGDDFCREGDEVSEPKGPKTGTARVFRGCSWQHAGGYPRSASRDKQAPQSPYSTLTARVCCRADFLTTSSKED